MHLSPGWQMRMNRVANLDYSKVSIPDPIPGAVYSFKTLASSDQHFVTLQLEENFWIGKSMFGIREKFFIPLGAVDYKETYSNDYDERTYQEPFRPLFELRLNYYLDQAFKVNPLKRIPL
jgi:hypothetical protein